MSVTLEKVQAYLALYETVQVHFEKLTSERSPSGTGRVKGSLRSYHAVLTLMEGNLAKREATKGDLSDLSWIKVCFGAMAEDKWVSDDLGGLRIPPPDASLTGGLGLPVSTAPLGFPSAMAMLADGLSYVLA